MAKPVTVRLLKYDVPVKVVVASVVLPFTIRVLLKIASPLKRLKPFRVVLERVMLLPEVKAALPPPVVVFVTAKNVPPPEVPSFPSFPSFPSLPAAPEVETYLVIYVTVLVEI